MEPLSLTFIGSVFVAGVLMFLAPCTLPLLPAYLGFLSGVTHEQIRDGVSREDRVRILLNALLFVVGFTTVFVLLGLLAGIAGAVIAPLKHILVPVGGVIVIVFGLLLIGVLKFEVFTKERRVQMPKFLTIGSPFASALLGAVFAFGWTPCVGPILGTVLLYAGSADTLGAGALLLLVFSMGFAVPFLALALVIGQATRVVTMMAPLLRGVAVVGGVVLVLLGLNLVLGDTFLTQWFFRLLDPLNMEGVLLRFL